MEQILEQMFAGQEQMMECLKAKTEASQERRETKMNVGQEQKLARMDVFGQKLDKMNNSWKTCLEKRVAKIETGLK